MPVDQIEQALSQLNVAERALLDLSLHRGFDDERIAALLGIEVSEIGAMRRAALEKLFRIRAVSGDGARDAVRAELRTVSDATWIDPSRTPARRRIWPAIAAAAVLLVAGVAAAIVLFAGSDDLGAGGPSRASPKPTQSAGVALESLSPDAPGQAVASVGASKRSQRLTVKLRGLPAPRGGGYELWLYDSLLHSRPLGSVAAGQGLIVARLPRGASNYGQLDLTLQPGPDRVHHSGESVFRTPLEGVLRSGSGQR